MTNSLEPSSGFGSAEPHPDGELALALRGRGGGRGRARPGSTAADAGGFASQSDAESWIGETWQDLLEEGVHQVSLFEAGRQVYGPMSLHAGQ